MGVYLELIAFSVSYFRVVCNELSSIQTLVSLSLLFFTDEEKQGRDSTKEKQSKTVNHAS